MNWYTVFYLFSIAERLGSFFGWMTFVFTVINVIAWVVFLAYKWEKNMENSNMENSDKKEDPDDLKIMRKWLWYSTIPFIFFWLAYIATPTKKDMLLIIAGGSVGQFLTTDASAKQLPSDVARFLHAEILKATSEIGDGGINPEVDKIKKLSREELEKLVLDQLGKNDSTKTK